MSGKCQGILHRLKCDNPVVRVVLVNEHVPERNVHVTRPVLSWSSMVKILVEENAKKDDCLWSEFYVIIITIEVVIRETMQLH